MSDHDQGESHKRYDTGHHALEPIAGGGAASQPAQHVPLEESVEPTPPQLDLEGEPAAPMPASNEPVGKIDPEPMVPSSEPLDEPEPAETEFDDSLTEVAAVPASDLEEAYAPQEESDDDLYSEALDGLGHGDEPGPELPGPDVGPSLNPRHMLESWLAQMVEARASDLILRAGGRPSCRVDGRITFLPGNVPAAGALQEVLHGIVGDRRMEEWRETGSTDVALQLDGLGRFRLNAYRQIGEPALVLRRVAETPPKLEALCLPTGMLQKLAKRKRGIILVTGVAGSGKSTTLAAMIQYMNESSERHIITLEDPVELLFREDRCVISQREVGTDVPTFSSGLRHCLRQSPDVILIGEMRDAETVQAALDATETGHLVMSTLHTVNAAQTVDRIVSFFPQEQHEQIRARLADNVAAVLSQRLIPRSSGSGMVPALELMTSTPRIMELLAEGRTPEISREIESGEGGGLISFNKSLRQLVEAGLIELEVALSASDKPDELLLALRGFNTAGARNQAPTGSEPQPRPQLKLESGGDELTLG